MYKSVGIKAAIKTLLETPEVSALLELAVDKSVQQKLGARLIYESKICAKSPVWTVPSPFEYSISSYIAVLLTVAPEYNDIVALCMLICKGLVMPHKIYAELSK
jgi:hypothetical protein